MQKKKVQKTTLSNEELVKKYQETESEEFLEEIINRFEKLIYNRIMALNIPQAEDAQQHGRYALILAARRFDPSKGTQFVTFAYPTVEGELKKFLRDTQWYIKFPRATKELIIKLKKHHKNWETFDEKMISSALNIPLEKAEEIYSSLFVSTPTLWNEAPDNLGSQETPFISSETSYFYSSIKGQLDEGERSLIEKHFFEGKTLHEIAILKRSTISKLKEKLNKIFIKIRNYYDGNKI